MVGGFLLENKACPSFGLGWAVQFFIILFAEARMIFMFDPWSRGLPSSGCICSAGAPAPSPAASPGPQPRTQRWSGRSSAHTRRIRRLHKLSLLGIKEYKLNVEDLNDFIVF